MHLRLIGDFDGSSAFQLLNLLKKCAGCGVYKIIINTGALNEIHPFGRDTFRKNLRDLNNPAPKLFFTGEHAGKIAPEKAQHLS